MMFFTQALSYIDEILHAEKKSLLSGSGEEGSGVR
jgi:hypothetical protein